MVLGRATMQVEQDAAEVVEEDYDCEKPKTLTIFPRYCPINFGYDRDCFCIVWALFSDHSESTHIHPKFKSPTFLQLRAFFIKKSINF